jgi:hypothetical protein
MFIKNQFITFFKLITTTQSNELYLYLNYLLIDTTINFVIINLNFRNTKILLQTSNLQKMVAVQSRVTPGRVVLPFAARDIQNR